ncbi:unnamed protein product [Dracunculus medinensis]|uniref:Neur_chan_memb domain-containing protein n=1 Tax=Dracunculus medinensis TaxID=318479 RepID=A0A0N4UBK7_DRAME|nr:unnamed protein product [Dracunculus medinensis]
MDIRLYLKPNCQLVLCKYPHDSQTCKLKISSFGFGQDLVRLHWFDEIDDAIKMNKKVKLPELYIVGYTKHICNGMRKSGNFSCLEARFHMKRTISYHLSHTYIPTAMCVIFSWISVWLPEEFVEGRVFLSLTVFLTLSAESGSTKEILPKVSYMKAIDIWYGFTTAFVFATMLQSLFVISLEHNGKELRKKIESNEMHIPHYKLLMLYQKAKLRSTLARMLDKYCKVLYPVIFIIFVIIYIFVITDGEENKCIR